MDTPAATPHRAHRLLIVVVVGGIFYLVGQYIASQPQRVMQEAKAEREITVQGTGEIQAKPDVAAFTLGLQSGVQSTAPAALKVLEDKFDAIVQAVRASGVAEEDITTTNLSIIPTYDYTDGAQRLRGFEANESVRVKIRKLDTIGDVLARATVEGVNQAGGLSLEIDDPESLQQEAQVKAIEDARDKAKELAKALNVRLGDVKTFSVTSGTPGPVPYLAQAELGSADKALGGPSVPVGTTDITANVTITFELR